MSFATGAIAEINLSALKSNYRLLAQKVAPKRCAAVVKANAYGLGVEQVAPALQQAGCSHFFVATIEEGVTLRRILPMAYIGVFYGVANAEDVRLAIANKLLPTLNSPEQIARWQAAAKKRGTPLPACVHVDTGMNRLGLSLGELQTLAETPDLLEGIEVLWLMSHLACAAMPDHPLNTQQLKHFETAQAIFPQWPSSFANSSGVFLGEAFHGELARPGAALYGINPTPAAKNPMRNVVTIKAPVLQVRQLHAPETVGYDATYVAPENATLATVACGYADGALRRMSNVSHVWIAGQKAPVAGIISMDVAVIDITNLPQHAVNAGDMVEFIGENIMLDIVADQAGTIGYEVLTNICPRVRRCYINNRE